MRGIIFIVISLLFACTPKKSSHLNGSYDSNIISGKCREISNKISDLKYGKKSHLYKSGNSNGGPCY